jgi:hypothetical protein
MYWVSADQVKPTSTAPPDVAEIVKPLARCAAQYAPIMARWWSV